MLSHKLRRYKSAAPAPSTDADFKQTVLLLHGDGTNGAQNNTFIDGSTNNFTITRNGNTTQGTFTPFSVGASEWSNYFNGSSGLNNGNSSTLLTNGNFTWECWVNFNSLSGNPCLLNVGTNGGNRTLLYFDSTNGIRYAVARGGSDQVSIQQGGTSGWSVGVWYHIALVQNGNDYIIYRNGVSVASGTSAYSQSLLTSAVNIGYSNVSDSFLYFNGYISNVRIVNGTAVYTSSFTPSTTPLTAITNTSLLTCQSNRFVDNSSNNFTVTTTGTPSVQPFSPFAPTSAYSTSVNGGSMYFDGTGDYLSIAHNTALNLSSGDFTIEAWVYWTGVNSTATICDKDGVFGSSYPSYNFTLNGSGYIRLIVGSGNGTSSIQFVTSNTLMPKNAWVHVAAVKNGTNLSIYQNGTSVASATQTATITDGGKALLVGWQQGQPTSAYWDGYISNYRLVKGTAVYTAAFTPPTAPLTAITNTSLLLNGTNAAIIDNTGKNVLETVADAQIDTGTKKYGTGSLEFDGTGDWLLAPNTVDNQLGTGNFTIEGWVYLNAIGSARGFVSKGTSTTGWSLGVNSLNQVVFNYASSTINSTGLLAISTWYFITVVREGTGSNQTKIYINGTNDGTGTVSTDFNQTNSMYVGADRVGGSALNGYIDDLRITKGVARYTATFTPPTAAFPDNS